MHFPDPMAVAIDWLDAYRASSLSIIDLYHSDAVLECGCNGQTTLTGRPALTEYWRLRFLGKPAGDLYGLSTENDQIRVTYEIEGYRVEATLQFDAGGQIIRSRCGPLTSPIQ